MTSEEALQIILNAKPVFGLTAQGHMPTIKAMLSQGKSWDEIGKAIGWCPQTANRHWEYLQAKGPTQEGNDAKNDN